MNTNTDINKTQICTKCNIEKPINDYLFRKDTNKYNLICKQCVSIQNKLKRTIKYQSIEHSDTRKCRKCKISKTIDLNNYSYSTSLLYSEICNDCKPVNAYCQPYPNTESLTCIKCNEEKPKDTNHFAWRIDNNTYRTVCATCTSKIEKKKFKNRNPYTQEEIDNYVLENNITHKECSNCNTSKTLDKFSKRNYSKDGRRGICNACRMLIEKGSSEYAYTKEQIDEYVLKNNVTHKTCNCCGTEKELNDFGITNLIIDGRHGNCRKCSYNNMTKYTIEEQEKYRNEKYPNGTMICYKCGVEKVFDQYQYITYNLYKLGINTICKCCTQDTKDRKLKERIDYLKENNLLHTYELKSHEVSPQNTFIYYELLFTNTITNENFIKIGITTVSIKSRYNYSEYNDYKYEIITELYTTEENMYLLEKLYLRANIEYSYQDKLTECTWGGFTETRHDVPELQLINLNKFPKYRTTKPKDLIYN